MKYFLLLSLLIFCVPGVNAQSSNFNPNNLGDSEITNQHVKPIDLKVYPNPCKISKLTIESGLKPITEIELMNIAGRRIMLKKFEYPENKKQLRLDNIQNGIYLVKIKVLNHNAVVKKLVVSK